MNFVPSIFFTGISQFRIADESFVNPFISVTGAGGERAGTIGSPFLPQEVETIKRITKKGCKGELKDF